MQPAERFVELLHPAADTVPLDEALLVLAAARPGAQTSVEAGLVTLDRFAAGCPTHTLEGVVGHLFDDLGFAGDRRDYHDPRNSLLDQVLERRLGMPITLSVVLLETARRLDISLAGVGMPGHFLVRDQAFNDLFIDAYAEGARLDAVGCRARFHSLHGPDAAFDPVFLQPVAPRSIVIRVLNNLTASLRGRSPRELDWLLDLRLRIPSPPPDQRALAELCELRGRYGDAAMLLDHVAAATDNDIAAERADRLRARLN